MSLLRNRNDHDDGRLTAALPSSCRPRRPRREAVVTPAELKALAEAATPGPWRFTPEDGLIRDAEDYHVVQVAGSPEHSQLKASAYLIALAPDLALLCAEMAQIVEKTIYQTPGFTGPGVWWAEESRAALAKLDELEAR